VKNVGARDKIGSAKVWLNILPYSTNRFLTALTGGGVGFGFSGQSKGLKATVLSALSCPL
jgi:hypothetical protein